MKINGFGVLVYPVGESYQPPFLTQNGNETMTQLYLHAETALPDEAKLGELLKSTIDNVIEKCKIL